MDDIARNLGVSKKTIYNTVSDKKELVFLSIAKHVKEHKRDAEKIFSELDHPIEQMNAIFQTMYRRVDNVNPCVFNDLKKSYPSAFKIFNSFKDDFIRSRIIDNLKNGIELGLYRSDLNPELIAGFYISLIDYILSVDKKEKELRRRQFELYKYHLRGIASLEGINYLEKNQLDYGSD
jgi:AcrR family transcriptional regulator